MTVSNQPIACAGCGRVMRKHPAKDEAVRRKEPHAARCEDCPPGFPCESRCEQCKGLRLVGLRWVP